MDEIKHENIKLSFILGAVSNFVFIECSKTLTPYFHMINEKLLYIKKNENALGGRSTNGRKRLYEEG